jgi:hypothetical protein
MKQLILILCLAATTGLRAADPFRTDINPALLYHQGLLMVPQFSEEDRKHVFETEWRTRPLDQRCTDLVTAYRNTFKMLRRAAASEVPCDWGIDMTDGPETLLPALARFKSVAQVAGLRARVHLAEGKQDAACEELLAVIAMGRNVSKDNILISILVQIAIENIIASVIAENFYEFTPETLEQFGKGLDSGPTRGLVQDAMPVEKAGFYDWLIRKINQANAEANGDPKQVQVKVRELWTKNIAESQTNSVKIVDQWIAATDGTAAGLIGYVKQLEPLYEEITEILGLPWSRYQTRYAAFEKKVRSHPNPLAREFFGPLGNSRNREFALQAKLAMLQAAIAYKLHGDPAFNSIADPFGDGPFTFRRFILDGIDRGFELESKLNCRGNVEKLILIEKPGPAVRVDSKYAGQKVP